jgi:hypothetical protein
MRRLRYAPPDSPEAKHQASTYLKHDSGVLARKLCIHIRLHLLDAKPGEKRGLAAVRRKADFPLFVPNPVRKIRRKPHD